MIAVMGASGNTGGRLAVALLEAGLPVRVIGRTERALSDLKRAGAEACVGDPVDPASLTAAFWGAGAVYTLLPYDVRASGYVTQQARLREAIVTAIQNAGVPRVVFLSSVGADVPSGTGFIASLHEQEQRLRRLDGVDVLILRAGSLFENFYGALPVIQRYGFNADSVAPDLPIPMIAARDIAAAVAALRTDDWTRVVTRELLGQRDLSYAEATRIIGERIGRPDLAYVRISDADLIDGLISTGFSPDAASLYVELNQAINERRIAASEVRTPENTTATRFEDFADELALAYRAA